MGDGERPPGQVCPDPDCNIDQRWEGFRGLACPNCGVRLVVACSRCDSGAVYEDDEETPYCSDHDPRQIATDGGTDKGGTDRSEVFRVEGWNDAPEGEEIACADCGSYQDLIGPVTLGGEIAEGGDMVCPDCGEDRGLDLTHCACGTSSPRDLTCPGCGDCLGYGSVSGGDQR